MPDFSEHRLLTIAMNFHRFEKEKETDYLRSHNVESSADCPRQGEKKKTPECHLTTDVGGFENGDKLSRETSRWLSSAGRFNGEFARG